MTAPLPRPMAATTEPLVLPERGMGGVHAGSSAGASIALTAKGGGIAFAGRLFTYGARFTIAVILARLLGAEQYGMYNLALTTATVAASFAVLGLDSGIVRYVAIYARRKDLAGLWGVLQLGVGLPVLIGLAIGIGLFVLADAVAAELLNEPRVAPLLRISSLLVPAMVLNRELAAALQGMKRIQYATVAEQFLHPIARFALLLPLILVGLTTAAAVAVSLVATVAAGVLLLMFVNRFFSLRRSLSSARRETGEVLRFSLPVYFSGVVQTLGGNLQVLLLAAFNTVTAVGIFAVANHITLVGSLFHSAVVAAAMPIFAELHDRGDRAGLQHLYQTASKWSFTLNLPLVLLVVSFPELLLSIFGPEFQAGALALEILAVGSLVNAATGTSGAMLDMTGYTIVKLLNSTLAVGLSIALSLMLIPGLGMVGAALAAFGATTTVNVLRLAQVGILLRMAPYNRTFGKPVLAGAGALAASMSTVSLLGPLGRTAAEVSGIAVLLTAYVGLILALGLTPEDRFVLGRARSRLRRRQEVARDADDVNGAADGPGSLADNHADQPDEVTP